jgi:histidine ammonia-lyase
VGTREVYKLVRDHAAVLDEDRPLSGDVGAMQRLIDGDAFAAVGCEPS